MIDRHRQAGREREPSLGDGTDELALCVRVSFHELCCGVGCLSVPLRRFSVVLDILCACAAVSRPDILWRWYI